MNTKKTDPGARGSFDAALLKVGAEEASQAVTGAGDNGPALVEAWVEAKNAAAVAAVAEDEQAPAPARKAARRGLNVLKARGVPVPERTRIAKVTGDAIEGYEAWFVAPDGAGTAMVLVGARWQSGKYHVVHTTVRDGIGLLEVRALEMSRSQLKTSFDESARRMGFAPVAVPVDWARARVAAARAENPKSGAILPLGLESHSAILGPAPEVPPPHPVDAAKLDIPSPETVVRASADLHREPEFGSWIPALPAVQEMLIDVGQKLGGAEQDQAKVDAAIGAALDAATDRFFAPETRARMADRMKDAAISILVRVGRERAAEVLAIANAVTSAGLITSPPRDIPFLRGFFQKALAMLAAQSGGQLSIPVPTTNQGEPLPADLGKEAARPGERVSPGGIILP